MQMTDQQMLQMTQQWQDKLTKRFEELRLRQWCVERAIEAMKGWPAEPPMMATASVGDMEREFKTGELTYHDPEEFDFPVVRLSLQILKFITAPFAETFAPASEREPDHHQV